MDAMVALAVSQCHGPLSNGYRLNHGICCRSSQIVKICQNHVTHQLEKKMKCLCINEISGAWHLNSSNSHEYPSDLTLKNNWFHKLLADPQTTVAVFFPGASSSQNLKAPERYLSTWKYYEILKRTHLWHRSIDHQLIQENDLPSRKSDHATGPSRWIAMNFVCWEVQIWQFSSHYPQTNNAFVRQHPQDSPQDPGRHQPWRLDVPWFVGRW